MPDHEVVGKIDELTHDCNVMVTYLKMTLMMNLKMTMSLLHDEMNNFQVLMILYHPSLMGIDSFAQQ